MKKFFTYFGVIFIALFMVSTVTAVTQMNSNPIMDKIDSIEENKLFIEEKISEINIDVENGGLIDFIIQIIQWLIDLVQDIINLVLEIFDLVYLIEYLIELSSSLFTVIMDLINLILGFFNSSFFY